MVDYFALDKAGLTAELEKLTTEYEQYKKMGLKLDMSRGKPEPQQLDISLPMLQMDAYIDDTGVDARNYGQLEGMPEARRYFAGLFDVRPEEVVVGGSSSLHLMYMLVDMGWRFGFTESIRPWKDCSTPKFLCPAPGYDRHFRVTEGFGFELITVPMTPAGPDMDIVEKLVQDESVKGMWCNPLYSNPDGYTYSDETVRRMAAMKTAAPDFKIFWDNAYGFHHLTNSPDRVLNILQECRKAGNENRPLLFVSTSKITFAGGGIGALAASGQNIASFLEYLFPMMICFDKVNQLRHVRFLKQEGTIETHMKKHAAILAPKFEKVRTIFEQRLGAYKDIARWTNPNGGYFISFYAIDGCATRIVQLCKEAGVVLTGAGAAFPYGKDPNDNHIRIAPTFPPIQELEVAAELLCIATCLASVEKLLGS